VGNSGSAEKRQPSGVKGNEMVDEQIHVESRPINRNQSWTSRKMDYINAANCCLAGGPFKVAVCILNHVNQHTELAWPSQETIAAKTGFSVPTVKRHVATLRRKEWIKTRVVWKEGKSHNVYTVCWQTVQAALDKLTEQHMAERNRRGNVVPFETPHGH
jgi:predicted transcriptional regulator